MIIVVNEPAARRVYIRGPHGSTDRVVVLKIAACAANDQTAGGAVGLRLFDGLDQAVDDARVQRIYAGTNEIMKELISRTL